MADRIEFGPVNRRSVGTCRVWTRSVWSEGWSLQPYLEVDEITWSAAPSLPTAVMRWDYGLLARPGFAAWGHTLRKSAMHRLYVKIEAELEFDDATQTWTQKDWYGVIDIVDDLIGGSIYQQDAQGTFTVYPRGDQRLVAYGLERMLQEHFVRQSYWRNQDAEPKLVERGLTFNARGLPNRHSQQVAATHYVFAGRRTESDYWSTRQIVRYLLATQTPKKRGAAPGPGTPRPPFQIAAGFDVALPDWDQPELPSHGLRTYDLLEQLIPRQRLTGWYLDVEPAAGEDKVVLKPFTYAAADINIGLGPARPIRANPNQYFLVLDQDRTAQVALKDSTVTAYDQVIVQGARRRSCFTICKADGTVDSGWDTPSQDLYNDGASTAGDYPAAAEVKKRQERNEEARAADKLRHVFSLFVLSADFDGRANAGLEEGDPLDDGDGGHPVFPVHDPLLQANEVNAEVAQNAAFPVCLLDLVMLPTLPLLMGVDYAGTVIADQTVDESTARLGRSEVPPLICWKLPNTEVDDDDQRWANIELLGRKSRLEKGADSENYTWSASVNVVNHQPAFELHVQGSPQHVLAKTDFTPLDVDDKIGPLGDHDWREMLATVCVPDDRYVQGMFPAELPLAIDSPRIMLIDAGDGYKQDYVARGTVVSIDGTTGQLERSGGGYVRNDTVLLTAAARVAFEYYGTTRRALTITTEYLPNFELGSFITQIGDDVDLTNPPLTVNTPITEIKLSIPRGTPENTDPPVLSLTTAAGELDPLRMLPRGGQALEGDPRPKRPVPKL